MPINTEERHQKRRKDVFGSPNGYSYSQDGQTRDARDRGNEYMTLLKYIPLDSNCAEAVLARARQISAQFKSPSDSSST